MCLFIFRKKLLVSNSKYKIYIIKLNTFCLLNIFNNDFKHKLIKIIIS